MVNGLNKLKKVFLLFLVAITLSTVTSCKNNKEIATNVPNYQQEYMSLNNYLTTNIVNEQYINVVNKEDDGLKYTQLNKYNSSSENSKAINGMNKFNILDDEIKLAGPSNLHNKMPSELLEPFFRYGTYEYFCKLDQTTYKTMHMSLHESITSFNGAFAKIELLNHRRDIIMDEYGIKWNLVDAKIKDIILNESIYSKEKITYYYGGYFYRSMEKMIEEFDLNFKFAIPDYLFEETIKYDELISRINVKVIFGPVNSLKDDPNFGYDDFFQIEVPENCVLMSYNTTNLVNFLDGRKIYIFGIDENNYIKTLDGDSLKDAYFSEMVEYVYNNIKNEMSVDEFYAYLKGVMFRFRWRLKRAIENNDSDVPFTSVSGPCF